jgi:pilus assembly protein CpaF
MEGDTVVLTDIFKFEQSSISKDGKVEGKLKPTGIRPLFGPALEIAGFKLKPEVFGANIAEMLAANRRR